MEQRARGCGNSFRCSGILFGHVRPPEAVAASMQQMPWQAQVLWYGRRGGGGRQGLTVRPPVSYGQLGRAVQCESRAGVTSGVVRVSPTVGG